MGIAALSLGGRGVGLREKSEVRNGSNSTVCLVPAFEFGKSVPHSGNDNKSQKTMGKLFNRRHGVRSPYRQDLKESLDKPRDGRTIPYSI